MNKALICHTKYQISSKFSHNANVSSIFSGLHSLTFQVLVQYIIFVVANKLNWHERVAFDNHVQPVCMSHII